MLGLSLGNCLSALLAWRYNRNEMLQDQPGKWMKKVMNTKMAGEDNHEEMMVGYKPAAVDTSTSCKKKDSNARATLGQMSLQIDRKGTVTSRRSFRNMPRKIELS